MDKEQNNENKKHGFFMNLWNKIIAAIRGEKVEEIRKLESGEKTSRENGHSEFLKEIQQPQELKGDLVKGENLKGDLVEKDNPETNLKGDLAEKNNPETNLRGDLIEKNSIDEESQVNALRDEDDISDTHEP